MRWALGSYDAVAERQKSSTAKSKTEDWEQNGSKRWSKGSHTHNRISRLRQFSHRLYHQIRPRCYFVSSPKCTVPEAPPSRSSKIRRPCRRSHSTRSAHVPLPVIRRPTRLHYPISASIILYRRSAHFTHAIHSFTHHASLVIHAPTPRISAKQSLAPRPSRPCRIHIMVPRAPPTHQNAFI